MPRFSEQTAEISIDLTTQDLTQLPSPEGLTEVDDICAVQPIKTSGPAANTETPMVYDEVEIELTAEEIDAMLEGRWKP